MPKITIEIEVEFEVVCAECGRDLDDCTDVDDPDRWSKGKVQVKPCPQCLENARNEGYEQASDE